MILLVWHAALLRKTCQTATPVPKGKADLLNLLADLGLTAMDGLQGEVLAGGEAPHPRRAFRGHRALAKAGKPLCIPVVPVLDQGLEI